MSDRLLWFSCGSGVWDPSNNKFSRCAVVIHVADFFKPSCSPEFDQLGNCVAAVEPFSNFLVGNLFFFHLIDRYVQHSTETSVMADFELAAVFFLQRPAFAAPEKEVYYDGVVNPESQVNWDFVVPEDISV